MIRKTTGPLPVIGDGPVAFSLGEVGRGVCLELVVDTEANDALVHLADDGVTIFKVYAKVLVDFIFDTGTQVQADVVFLAQAVFLSLEVHHCVVQACQGVDEQLVMKQSHQIVGVDVYIPPRHVVSLKEVVKAHLGAQLVEDAVLETCSNAQILNFATVHQIGSNSGLALMHLCLTDAHTQDERTH